MATMCEIMGQTLLMQKGLKQVAALQVFKVERKGWLVGRQTAPYSMMSYYGGWTTLQRALEKELQCLPREVRQVSWEETGSEL